MNLHGSSHGRILVVDDNELVHEDFRKVLCPDTRPTQALEQIERLMFESDVSTPVLSYELDFAFQGEEALELVRAAVETERPYRLAFIDMRMPPGWDGLRTMSELSKIDPNLQFVVCSAFSDFNPDEIAARLGRHAPPLHLPKPFAADDIREIAFILAAQADELL